MPHFSSWQAARCRPGREGCIRLLDQPLLIREGDRRSLAMWAICLALSGLRRSTREGCRETEAPRLDVAPRATGPTIGGLVPADAGVGGNHMPTVHANGIDIYYEVQGEGEPIVLIPYLAADQQCYAFQVRDYGKHFKCFTVDLRGAGRSSKPSGTYTTELFADDVAAFMQAAGVERAHVAGLSLGAATGMWLAAKYPTRVK